MKSNIQLASILIIIILLSCPNQTTGNSGSSGEEDSVAERNDDACKVNINLTGSFQNPVWSPDGTKLLFTRFRNGYNEGAADLYIIDLATLTLTPLVTDGSENVNLPGSVWNSTIDRIVFSSSIGDPDPDLDHDEIYYIDDDGSDLTKLTERVNLQAYEPSFSPDGGFVVFESHVVDVEVDGKIIKKDLSQTITTGFTELTTTGDCRQPNWSPDGNYILFQKVVGNKWDIWIMDNNGSDPSKTRVTTTDGDNTDASFSSDGQRIVYSADGDLECANIYVIPITGGAPKRLTFFNGGYDGAPSWSPVEDKVAFESYPGDPDGSSGTTIWIIDIPAGF